MTELKKNKVFKIFMSSRAERGDRKILRLIRHFIPRNNGVIIHKAFTFAEVLITLLIIGVVASLVVPNLINNSQNAEYTTSVKKVYSDFYQAYKFLQVEYGGSIIPIFSSDTMTNYGNGAALNAFLTKMNYSKNCGTGMGCWYNTPRYYLNGALEKTAVDSEHNGSYEKARLSNGTSILLRMRSTDCTYDGGSGPLDSSVCASLGVDINGDKGPNKLGRDYFSFWVTKTGIFPSGNNSDGYSCVSTSATYNTCLGCANKVLSENGMNY
jgi:prepilin-type N-terminal cleavage/methylation domain-containing protein